jgi:2-succinyl-6-hydroxy-2,4-cyclohexadiene-1-carboxylate synthase
MPVVHANGLAFFVDDYGDGDPLYLLHGFTGSSRSWSSTGDNLKCRHRVLAVDLIGHGKTSAPTDVARYHFDQALDDLAAIADQLGVSSASWLGYSMGGRVALGLALHYPHLVSSLILESASPGIADPIERAERANADAALADRTERDGVPPFVDDWERLPLWSSQAGIAPDLLAKQREIRLHNSAPGLAGSLRGMGTGAQSSYWDRLGELTCPVLIIAGALDAKFVGIARRMAESIPTAEICLVPQAGHAVHLERPDQFLDVVSQFLE